MNRVGDRCVSGNYFSCRAVATTCIVDHENDLAAAGFLVRPADTAERRGLLAQLPAHKFVQRVKELERDLKRHNNAAETTTSMRRSTRTPPSTGKRGSPGIIEFPVSPTVDISHSALAEHRVAFRVFVV
jgi:hypothetical protein